MDPASMTLGLWIWRHGTPGERAWILADPALIGACQAAPSFQEKAAEISADAPPPPPQDLLAGLTAAMQALHDAAAPKADARRACVADLAAKLRAGAVVAMGYASPRRHDDAPVVIKRHQLPEHSSLAASTYTRGTLAFEDVRLLPRDEAQRLQAAWDAGRPAIDTPSKAPPPKASGPVGSQRHIEAAYRAMREAGEIDLGGSVRAHYSPVRRRLAEMFPDQGYGDARPARETLRKTLSELFAEDRARAET